MDVKPAPPSPDPAAITHYENFPVASWLCPPALRAPIAALYHFARTADDLADEGEIAASQRLSDLAAYRDELRAVALGHPRSTRWRQVFDTLATHLKQHQLPLPLLEDLISAFEQDVAYTRDALTYPDRAALLDYCRRSANPVGRLLLHLYDVQDPDALAQSDAICTSLQLINFWQDLRQDIPRGRHYLCDADCLHHGVSREQLVALRPSPQVRALIADNLDWAENLMHRGAPLVHRLAGRAGWELRLVVQGGLQVIRRIRALDCDTLSHRPKLGAGDFPPMLWRAARMRAPRMSQ